MPPTRVDQSKTVQARITKSSLSAAWKTLVSGTVKLFHKFKGALNERGGQNLWFLVNKSLYLSNCVRQGLGYYKSLLGSRTLALDWRRIQWPWTPKYGVLWIFWRFRAATQVYIIHKVEPRNYRYVLFGMTVINVLYFIPNSCKSNSNSDRNFRCTISLYSERNNLLFSTFLMHSIWWNDLHILQRNLW